MNRNLLFAYWIRQVLAEHFPLKHFSVVLHDNTPSSAPYRINIYAYYDIPKYFDANTELRAILETMFNAAYKTIDGLYANAHYCVLNINPRNDIPANLGFLVIPYQNRIDVAIALTCPKCYQAHMRIWFMGEDDKGNLIRCCAYYYTSLNRCDSRYVYEDENGEPCTMTVVTHATDIECCHCGYRREIFFIANYDTDDPAYVYKMHFASA